MAHLVDSVAAFDGLGAWWDGLDGNVLQTLDHVATSREAIETACLDWQTVKVPLAYRTSEGYVESRYSWSILRTDTKTELGTVGSKYNLLQNTEAFEFFDNIVGERLAMYHTAGSLNEGRKIFILARLPHDLRLQNEDVLSQYILLTNSHDGSQALDLRFTSVRVICNNTMQLALGRDTKNAFRAEHTASMRDKFKKARELLGLSEAYLAVQGKTLDDFIATTLTKNQAFDTTLDLFNIEDVNGYRSIKRASLRDAIDSIMTLFTSGQGNNGENCYDYLNAVTEYVDHIRPIRGNLATIGSQNPVHKAQRLNNALYGTGTQLKDKAFNALSELVVTAS